MSVRLDGQKNRGPALCLFAVKQSLMGLGRRRNAGWARTAMQILRRRATPRWMGRRHHANSPEQRDAVGDGQVPPCKFSGAEHRLAE
ncbi:Hypothetical predicted protein [Cloeon dipterum]|uniref:Uncharacterized protein n=1 Tax=Cloeon dipterum TaxID=197152 RepID=A0A8S1DHH7_9INSE|nr:Hypothetical predicted protein [Cloeon dipterum]